MKFRSKLVTGTLLKREKRFLAYVKLKSGEEVVAHCANPGSMRGNAVSGAKVWLEDIGADHLAKGKKLRYRWVFVEAGGVKVCVDTSIANRIVGEGLGLIPELKIYEEVRTEFTEGDSRFDFLLESKKKGKCFVEVKSVSMGEGVAGSFPDSVTVRGQKHVLGLQKLVEQGHRAILFFLLVREKGESVSTAKEIDPAYDQYLRAAIKKGVEVMVYNIAIGEDEISLGEKGKFL